MLSVNLIEVRGQKQTCQMMEVEHQATHEANHPENKRSDSDSTLQLVSYEKYVHTLAHIGRSPLTPLKRMRI